MIKVCDLKSYQGNVYAWCRDERNMNVKYTFPYEWYFYIRSEYIDKVHLILKDYNMSYRIEKGRSYAKVFMDMWEARKGILEELHARNIPTYEGDLKLEDRFRYDKKITIDKNVDLLYFDIETDDRIRQIQVGRDHILSFAAIDQKGKKYFVRLEAMTPDKEQIFLQQIIDIFKKYHIVAGWNIKNFDLLYLEMRCRRYDLRLPWTGRYDMFERAKHIYRFDSTIKSFSLENFSQMFLQRGKVKHGKKIFDMWNDNDPQLREYNEEDALLCHDLDKVLNICGMMILQSEWCRVPPKKFSLYALIDSVIIQTSHKLGRPVPTNLKALRSYDDPEESLEDIEKYMGAEVLDPVIGMHKNVYVFDFKGLYPSIMMTLNIGYDSLRLDPEPDCIVCPGTINTEREDKKKIVPTYFSKGPSCVAEAIKTLVGLRTEYKNLKLKYIEEGKTDLPEYQKVVSDEIIVKELSNSTYGIMGMQYGRYFNVDVAESITLTGRWILQFARKYFQIDRGYNVIYGDTDSIFIQSNLDLDLDVELAGFHKSIERELMSQYNVPKSYIQLNFDKHYTNFILFAKKTYAGHCDNMEGKKTDKLYVRGMEYIKRNTFQWAAQRQKQLLEDLLRGNIHPKTTIDKIREYKAEFFKTEFNPQELKITQRIGKEEYNNKGMIAYLTKRYKELTGVNPIGTEIEFVITSNKKKLTGCLLQEYNGRFSRDHYWENLSRPLFDKLLDVVDPGKNIDYATLFEND